MAKKRKGSSRNPQNDEPTDNNLADARLGPIDTYEDVADSEEEYFLNRDKILFDDGPQTKRRKRQQEEDQFLEISDEEILNGGAHSSDEEETLTTPRKSTQKLRHHANSDDESMVAARQRNDEDDSGWWGDSKEDYYNADQAETEADALGEETEAKRMQQKKLAKMSEEDFLFQESDWYVTEEVDKKGNTVVTEVLDEAQITEDMTPEQRLELLQLRYPEFNYLVHEFEELQPTLADLSKEATGKTGRSITAIKYWVLGCYVAALASYFAILTSPSRDASAVRTVLSPSDLRDHEVMETLIECRKAWQRISGIRAAQMLHEVTDTRHALTAGMVAQLDPESPPLTKRDKKQKRLRDKQQKAKAKQAKAVEESLADIDDLMRSRKPSTMRIATTKNTENEDDNSDFGEEDTLDARTAAEKAARKMSLRFYTSQIVQKASRRAGAGRDAGGDMDIPYRERLRDRQARLNAEAERRGHKDSKHGTALGAEGDDSGGEDGSVSRGADDDDEYYNMMASKALQKKADKAALHQALAAATKSERVVEHEEVGDDGKRKITYAIEKNKGLAPKRKKENRNPRVKKKLQYEAKQKKLRSMKATFKGGEPRGGYGGELSGISTGVVRARKL